MKKTIIITTCDECGETLNNGEGVRADAITSLSSNKEQHRFTAREFCNVDCLSRALLNTDNWTEEAD